MGKARFIQGKRSAGMKIDS